MKWTAIVTVSLCLSLVACQPASIPLNSDQVTHTLPSLAPSSTTSSRPVPAVSFTPFPSDTSTPSETPSSTLTPRPFAFQDDFSGTDQGSWSALEHTSRQNGELLVGPFEPFEGGFNPQFTLCIACGERSYFRSSVDVTFESGQTDRFYGMYAPLVPGNGYNALDHMYYLGISPMQAYRVRQYNLVELNYQDLCKGPTPQDPNGLVRPGRLENHLEIEVKPSLKQGKADLFFYVNGVLICSFYFQDAIPSRVGLGMDFHSQQVSYANFQYEEILP
jgi:hypothetical protein